MTYANVRTKIYILAVSLLGLASLITHSYHFHSTDPVRFSIYLVIVAVCSGLKVSLPGIKGTMSVSYVIFLLGFIQLSLSETLVMGLVSTLVQSVWHAKQRPKPVQVVFNIASIAIAITGGYAVYHSPLWAGAGSPVHPLALVTAACGYFLLNTLSIALVVGLSESKSSWQVWKECYFWSFPYYLLGASITGAMDYFGQYVGWEVSVLVLPLVYVIYRSYGLYLDRLEGEKNHAQQMASLHLRTIEALALAIEAMGDNTHEHLYRVQVYATEIGKEMGLSQEELSAIQAAAILHDIGKLAVPDYIISKPGKLTPEEFEKMKIHPVVGAEILERVQFPYPVVPIVRSHHEKWDGSGYPDGLKGEQIPIGARILSTVDCLDALASERQYRRALPLEKALEVVQAEAGRSFDPKVVDLLSRRAASLEKKAKSHPISGPPLKLSPPLKLRNDIKVERGLAPAAGFEKIADQTKQPNEGSQPLDFLHSIAGARQEMQQIYELTHDMGNSLSLSETLSVVCTRLKDLIPHDTVAIYLRTGGVLKPCYVSGENSRFFSSLESAVGQGLSGWVSEHGKAIFNGNPGVESGYLGDSAKFTTLRSALAVPLHAGEEVMGVLTLYALEKDIFSRDHLRILLAIETKLAMAVKNARRFQQAQEKAATDGLTGLPNARSLFLHLDKELSRCRRSEVGLSVVVCDLDGFKELNDRHGHLAGNEVLRLLAERMQEHCREYDCVARMGGDEFVLILPEFPKEGIERKIQALAELANQVGHEVCGESLLNLSAGCALFPDDGLDADQLLATADGRLYQAKRTHRTQSD